MATKKSKGIKAVLHSGVGNPTGGSVTINLGRIPTLLHYDVPEEFHPDQVTALRDAFPFHVTAKGTKCGFEVLETTKASPAPEPEKNRKKKGK